MYSPGNALVVGNVTSSSNFTFQHNLTYGTLGSDILVDGTKIQRSLPAFQFLDRRDSLVQLSGHSSTGSRPTGPWLSAVPITR